MNEVFISYASPDRSKARALAEALSRQGWSVWWDRNIPPGKSFDLVIEEALDAAKCVIVLWSRASASSEWVKNEAAEAARRKILVPALIEDVKLPLEFRRIQTANLSDWDGDSPHADFDEFLKSVATLLGSAVQQSTQEPVSGKLGWYGKRTKTAALVLAGLVLLATVVLLLPRLIGWATKYYTATATKSEQPSTTRPGAAVHPIAQSAYLDYSLDLARWNVHGYRPQSTDLSKKAPASNWATPPSKGLERLYGTLTFGDKTKIGVVVDVLDSKESQMVVTFDGDTDFRNKPVYKTENGSVPDPIEFQIEYPDGLRQKYAIRVYFPISFAHEIGAYRLHYYRASLRQGKIKLGDREYPIAIGDGNTDGQFSDLKNTELWIDSNDKGISGEAKELSAASSFPVAGTYYMISEINPSGSKLTVTQARVGTVVGKVVNAATGDPLPGTKIKLSPNDISSVTGSDGRYRVEVPEGEYWQLAALANGYVPNYVRVDKRVEAEHSTTVDVSLTPDTTAGARSGVIRLAKGDSYHFLSGERHQYTGGDFYFGFSKNEAKFWANNQYQQGLADLGSIEKVSLTQVAIPLTVRYYKFGVPALEGHTYVSPAKAGEEGHYVIFRVIGLKMGEYVEIEFYYR